MSEPITPTTTLIGPPPWCPALLAALAAADANTLHQRRASSYTRPAFPREWWPAQPGNDTRVHVTLDGRGGITRRLVVLS